MNAPVDLPDTPQRYRLRVEDYLLLSDSGTFADFARTELIDGAIYGMNAQYAEHARTKSRLSRLIGNLLEELGSEFDAINEVSLRVSADSMPQPDVVVTSWRGTGPVPVETVALVIEVSDTTFDFDVGIKAELYAGAGIPEYWIVDLAERRVLIHELPADGDYLGQGDVPVGEPLMSGVVEGLRLDSDRIFD